MSATAGTRPAVDIQPVRLAQAPQVPLGPIPTDITPVDIGSEAEGMLNPQWRFRLFQKLPPKLWLNATTEVSQRLDTNVFFTYSHPRCDYTFRALPNVTLGYNVLTNSSIYCNWFLIKDLFAAHGHTLSFPTTQSLSLGFRHDMTLNPKTFLQADFQARELWQTTNLNQADLLPALNVTRLLWPGAAAFGSVVLQMRSADYFQGAQREIDPFYNIGFLYRRGSWTFLATDTLVTNFRRRNAIPNTGNVSMIADIELSRPVSKKFPALVAFVRAEPIWNWSSHKQPGLSGFDFRFFGGLRLTMNKPSYAAQVAKLKKQLMESEPGTPTPPRPPQPSPSSKSFPPDANMFPRALAGRPLELPVPQAPVNLSSNDPDELGNQEVRMFVMPPL